MAKDSLNTLGRTVPHNSDVEAGIIGAVLRNNDVLMDFELSLHAEIFYVPAHRRLWELIIEQLKNGNPATPATLRHFVEGMEELNALGGVEYLAKLTFEEFSIISPKRYAEILLDLYHKREIIRICEQGVHDAYDVENDEKAKDIADRTETNLFQLEAQNVQSRSFSLAESLNVAIDEVEKIATGKQDLGVSTGFTSLKNVIGGLRRSDLIILAARPAMGKTSLAMNIAFNAAKSFHVSEEKKSVVFFSLEMSAEQLAMRILSDRAGIAFENFRLGNISAKQFQDYKKTQKEIAAYPLYLEENPGINLAEMRAALRKISRKVPVGIVFLDYLQLLSSQQNGRRFENRVNELSEITRGLKLLAREFDVPIVVLSQLSRAVESRENKTPILADLRESGSIEQDADIVMFLYRPEYYHYLKEPQLKEAETEESFQKRVEQHQKNADLLKGKAEVVIAKNRHGAPCKVEMMFNHQLLRFVDKEHRFSDEQGFPAHG